MGCGHECVVFDYQVKLVRSLVKEGAIPAPYFDDLLKKIPNPRIIWLTLPSENHIERILSILALILDPGDLVIYVRESRLGNAPQGLNNSETSGWNLMGGLKRSR